MGDLYVSTKYLPGIRLKVVSKAGSRLAGTLYGKADGRIPGNPGIGRIVFGEILGAGKADSAGQKSPSVIVDMRRSTMRLELMQMLFQGVIQPSDLEGFSQELRDGLTFVMQKYSGQGV